MKKTKTEKINLKGNLWKLIKFGIGAVIGVISIIIAFGLAGAIAYFIGGAMLHSVAPYIDVIVRTIILK